MNLWESINGKDMDVKRILAHVLPGFLLFAAVVMIYDIISSPADRISTNFILKPGENLTNIETFGTIGLSVGLIFGIVIDGLGHNVFEHHVFKFFQDYKKIEKAEERAFKYWMNRLSLGNYFGERTADYLYDIADSQKQGEAQKTDSLKKILIDNYYSFQEFYLNSGISLFLTSFVIPIYLLAVLHVSNMGALAGFAVAFVTSTALLFTSYHTHIDYRKTRIAMIEARLRLREIDKQNQAPVRLSPQATMLPYSPPIAIDYCTTLEAYNDQIKKQVIIQMENICFNPYSTQVEIASVTLPRRGGTVTLLNNNNKTMQYLPPKVLPSNTSYFIDEYEFTLKDSTGRIDTGKVTIEVSLRATHTHITLREKEKLKSAVVTVLLPAIPIISVLIFLLVAFPQTQTLLPYAQNFVVPAAISFTLGESNNWFGHQTVTLFNQTNLIPVIDPHAPEELKKAIHMDTLNGTKPQNRSITVDGSKLSASAKQPYNTKIILQDQEGRAQTSIELNIVTTPSITIDPSKVSVKLNITEAKKLNNLIVNISNPNLKNLTSSKVHWLNSLKPTDKAVVTFPYPDEYPQRMNIIVNASEFVEPGPGTYFGYVVLSQPDISRPVATIDLVIDVVS